MGKDPAVWKWASAVVIRKPLQRQLYAAGGVLLHISAELYGKSGSKSGCGAILRRGQKMKATE